MTPTPATYRKRRSKLPTMLAAIAAVSVVAIGAIILAWQLGWAAGGTTPGAANSPTGRVLSAETQMECTAIRREHENWTKRIPEFRRLTPQSDITVASFAVGKLKEDGTAYLKAVSGYPDRASKDLAVAVAQYNVDLGFFALDLQLGSKFSPDKHETAIRAASALQASYDTFVARTCG